MLISIKMWSSKRLRQHLKTGSKITWARLVKLQKSLHPTTRQRKNQKSSLLPTNSVQTSFSLPPSMQDSQCKSIIINSSVIMLPMVRLYSSKKKVSKRSKLTSGETLKPRKKRLTSKSQYSRCVRCQQNSNCQTIHLSSKFRIANSSDYLSIRTRKLDIESSINKKACLIVKHSASKRRQLSWVQTSRTPNAALQSVHTSSTGTRAR